MNAVSAALIPKILAGGASRYPITEAALILAGIVSNDNSDAAIQDAIADVLDQGVSSENPTMWVAILLADIAVNGIPQDAGDPGSGDMLRANNLSDVLSVGTARTNLGLGSGNSPTFAGLTLGAGAAITSSGPGGALGTAAFTAASAYQPADADLTTWAGITPGTGIATALAIAVGTAGAPVLFNGAGGTPSSLVGTNITGIPPAGVTGTAAILGANTFTGAQAITLASLGTTSTDGVTLTNTTAATGGATVQISPRLRFRGNAWDTAASQTVDFFIENLPATAATPTGTLKFLYSLNGAAATTPMSLTSAGAVSAASFTASGSLIAGSTGKIEWTNRAELTSSASGKMQLSLNTAGGGVTFDASTDGNLNLRNFADTGYGTLAVEWLSLTDGITAPAAVAGRARIYVDTADGDLKVIFGDGTVKTIVVDT